jgi:hypothetical protein
MGASRCATRTAITAIGALSNHENGGLATVIRNPITGITVSIPFIE